MKFGNSVSNIFIIEHTQFVQDAFGFDISVVHCLGLGLQFFRGHSLHLYSTSTTTKKKIFI